MKRAALLPETERRSWIYKLPIGENIWRTKVHV